jgi:uncharacterized coiled-coil protein SlyX
LARFPYPHWILIDPAVDSIRPARLESLRSNHPLMFKHIDHKLLEAISQIGHDYTSKLDRIIDLLHQILHKENIIMATIQDLTAAVAAESTVDDSIIALLNGIVQQLKDAQASGDPAALDAVVASIQANTAKIQDAVTANTPVVPVP